MPVKSQKETVMASKTPFGSGVEWLQTYLFTLHQAFS